MKRSRVNPMSDKRHAENVQRREAMIRVRNRDGHECVGAKFIPQSVTSYLPEPCFGPLNGHEIITRADGGSITDPNNIVLLCDFHNGWCDLNYDDAKARGFREPRWNPESSKVASHLPHMERAE